MTQSCEPVVRSFGRRRATILLALVTALGAATMTTMPAPAAPADRGAIAAAVLDSGASTAAARDPVVTRAAEYLRYRATWNGLPVAAADLLITPLAGRSRGAVQLRGHAETNEVLDLLWRMRDSFEATVATDPPAPERFLLRQHENTQRRVTEVARDASHARLIGTKRRHGRDPRVASVGIHRRLHDPASLGYLISRFPDDVNAPQTYQVFTGTKTYDLTVSPAGKDTVELAGRSWRARKLRLTLRLVAIDDGRRTGSGPDSAVQEADLWISSSPERLPLRLEAQTFWGWVAVELTGRGSRPSEQVRTS